eukprot:COSAG01_NODE_6488_length_3634_cov_18.695332_1_plen_714_part_00
MRAEAERRAERFVDKDSQGEGQMAEEGTPPLAAAWSVEQVAAWVLTLEGIDNLEAVAAKVREEEVDGVTLMAYKDRLEVKVDLSLSAGKATRLFLAIETLRGAPAAAAVAVAGGSTGGAAPTAYASHGPGSEVWTHANSLLQNTWIKHGLHEFTQLIEVKEIQNALMRERYEAFKAGMREGVVNGNEMLVFHGCGVDAIESIAEKGFLKSFQNTNAWQRFGLGFYFALQVGFGLSLSVSLPLFLSICLCVSLCAQVWLDLQRMLSAKYQATQAVIGTQASKSHEYPLAEMESVPVGQHRRTMIMCKVARGKECKTAVNMDKLPAAPEGYDSVHGVATPDGPLNFDELVVYNERAILPYAIVTYEYEKLANAAAPAPAVAEEELFVVKVTGEVLSVMQLFERNIPKSDTWSVGEAAGRLRANISGALTAAKAQRDTLGTGMKSIERCVRKLHESRSAAEAQIESSMEALQNGLVASVTTALVARKTQLMEALSADFCSQQTALESQRETVATRFSGQQRVCEDGATSLERSNLEVVRLGQQIQRDIAASHEVLAPIQPVRTGEIEARLEIDFAAEEEALVQRLLAFGSVGLRPPSLDAYSNMAPSYTVGTEAPESAPQGKIQTQIGVGGLHFTATGMPEGLSIDRTTGAISGTPTTPTPDATATLVTARNDAGESQLTLNISVNAAVFKCKYCCNERSQGTDTQCPVRSIRTTE